MILLFPINDYERDQLDLLLPNELVGKAAGDPHVLSYAKTSDFLEALDNQEIDPQAYWHREVEEPQYIVSYHLPSNDKDIYRVLCPTKGEAVILVKYLHHWGIEHISTVCRYLGATPDKEDGKNIIWIPIRDVRRNRNFPVPESSNAIFSVTFTYETPLTGKHHYVVECDTDEEAQKIAHDANTVDGIKYVHTYPVKRPTGMNGIRMTAEEYWKMYGSN